MQNKPSCSRCKSAPPTTCEACICCAMKRIMDWMRTNELSDAKCEKCLQRDLEKRALEEAAQGECSHMHGDGDQSSEAAGAEEPALAEESPAPSDQDQASPNQGGDFIDPGEGTSRDFLTPEEDDLLSDLFASTERTETDEDAKESNGENLSSEHALGSEAGGGSSTDKEDDDITEEMLKNMWDIDE